MMGGRTTRIYTQVQCAMGTGRGRCAPHASAEPSLETNGRREGQGRENGEVTRGFDGFAEYRQSPAMSLRMCAQEPQHARRNGLGKERRKKRANEARRMSVRLRRLCKQMKWR